MSIVNAAPKGGACNLFLKKKFWLLKDFNNKHFLNKKLEIFSKFKHENQQKSGGFVCSYIAVSF